MTKPEFIAQHGGKAETQAASNQFIALLETAREECPYVGASIADPTSIVRNEGKLQGWHECLKFLKTAHIPKKEPSPLVSAAHYQDPEKVNRDNKP